MIGSPPWYRFLHPVYRSFSKTSRGHKCTMPLISRISTSSFFWLRNWSLSCAIKGFQNSSEESRAQSHVETSSLFSLSWVSLNFSLVGHLMKYVTFYMQKSYWKSSWSNSASFSLKIKWYIVNINTSFISYKHQQTFLYSSTVFKEGFPEHYGAPKWYFVVCCWAKF